MGYPTIVPIEYASPKLSMSIDNYASPSNLNSIYNKTLKRKSTKNNNLTLDLGFIEQEQVPVQLL